MLYFVLSQIVQNILISYKRNKIMTGKFIMNIDDLTKSERISRIAGSLLNDKILDMVQMQREPFETLIAYYRCAAMEIETKLQ